jgi:hypothetical protein
MIPNEKRKTETLGQELYLPKSSHHLGFLPFRSTLLLLCDLHFVTFFDPNNASRTRLPKKCQEEEEEEKAGDLQIVFSEVWRF